MEAGKFLDDNGGWGGGMGRFRLKPHIEVRFKECGEMGDV